MCRSRAILACPQWLVNVGLPPSVCRVRLRGAHPLGSDSNYHVSARVPAQLATVALTSSQKFFDCAKLSYLKDTSKREFVRETEAHRGRVLSGLTCGFTFAILHLG